MIKQFKRVAARFFKIKTATISQANSHRKVENVIDENNALPMPVVCIAAKHEFPLLVAVIKQRSIDYCNGQQTSMVTRL
jgi:hypothetical protein